MDMIKMVSAYSVPEPLADVYHYIDRRHSDVARSMGNDDSDLEVEDILATLHDLLLKRIAAWNWNGGGHRRYPEKLMSTKEAALEL